MGFFLPARHLVRYLRRLTRAGVSFLTDMSVALPSEDSCPKRFGLIYDPPSLILEYRQVSTARLFHRRIGLKRLKPSSDPVHIAESIRRKNRHLLGEDKVFLDQLVSLVKKLQAAWPQQMPKIDYPRI